MDEQQAKAALAALSPEARAERQRIVDEAVRYAARNGYCGTFNEIIRALMPEMIVEIGGSQMALDSQGRACHTEDQTVWEYHKDQRPAYSENGYDQNGRDRDGFDQYGYDSRQYDANGMGRAMSREYRTTRWVDENGFAGEESERWYATGYGQYSARDAEGNLRPGRPATPEEVAAESVELERFNPTTWSPEEA